MRNDCSLAIIAARTDVSFISHTIPHFVRSCNYPFTQRVLLADIAPLSGNFLNRPQPGSIEDLLQLGKELVANEVIDRTEIVSYSAHDRSKIVTKHFGETVPYDHDARGSPILSYVFSIEQAQSPYLLNTDSDMLLYQHHDYSWIDAGIELLRENVNVICVMPRPGPPREDGSLCQPVPYVRNDAGYFRFDLFSSRLFLIDVKRFKRLLPLKVHTVSHDGTTRSSSNLANWEAMVTSSMRQCGYARADLDIATAWTLHPVDRGTRFNSALPSIIRKLQSGWYPADQAGHYDLILKLWV
jgi:hypothetical protein